MSKETATKTTGTTGTDTEAKEPVVKINRDRYKPTKTATGVKSLNNGDEVAATLDGLTIDELFTIGKDMLGEDYAEKYAKLNIGMQRMNMGNRLRAKVRSIDADNEKAVADAEKEGKTAKPAKSGLEILTKTAAPFTKARDQRVKDAAAEKEAKQKEREEKAKAAAEKKKQKAEAKAKAEKEATKPKTAKAS